MSAARWFKRVDEVRGQRQDVAAPLPQRGHQDEDDEAEVEVLAERAVAHRRLEIAVGGGDDAHVDLDASRPPMRLELLFLQHAQQLGLQLRRHVADFVEEQRAAVGGFEEAWRACSVAPVKAPLLVAEQLALQEIARHGRAVHARRTAPLQRVECSGWRAR